MVLALSFAAFSPVASLCTRTNSCSLRSTPHSQEASLLRQAAEVADLSAGLTAPHPNFGCVIARGTDVVGHGFLYAQGTKCAELQAVEIARELSRGATAYLNLEPGDCYGDLTPVSSLVQAGISRVVVGIRHPLHHLRGKAIQALRSQGVQVDVVGEDLLGKAFEVHQLQEALKSCLVVNAPLLYWAAYCVPFSVLKFAMTLDGKIAASSGHASWVSSKVSRHRVFELRGRSDAIIVGGNTVRRDDPQLTARHGGGHVPARIVLSRTLDFPEERKLWNVFDAYTIVATQRGACKDMQKKLASKGVEVVEFDFLNPKDVMEYCYDRGYLSLLWECGGSLSAPAIKSGVIHKLFAFVAPKIIGGENAPSPVGELGNVEMTQAIDLIDVSYEQAHKFIPADAPLAGEFVQQIKIAKSPEEAARLGRKLQRQHPEMVREDWDTVKIDVMYSALKCKFSTYSNLKSLLCSTAGCILVEASPHDLFWGGGREGEGLNYLGRLLMKLRSEIMENTSTPV
ncbi:riboflavin biosynthesis protein PYRR, chloroplastic isoform X5 [Dioscorea cayenensis subsp. rotundata]|uniref:5-amino-6-(5-phosphoribosylamino)uracil reductase n=1 Tax=Dioscorea cayennensis subsp. rotundata TaxID=55577 RepID=A0AB40AVQ2_DIOCR|nr:riboflavin biosynthesis protein PYRR, chloroplastic isoform X5 [Dioscorea cayenensis subsp. rotundata]